MAKNDALIKEYRKQYKNYLKRYQRWVEHFHAVPKLIPEIQTKNSKPESIERLKKEQWKKFSKRKVKEAKREYEKRYEEGQEGIYFPKPPYVPPTEHDWLTKPESLPVPQESAQEDEQEDEDGYTPIVDSKAELAEWINKVIYSVVESLPEREVLQGVAERLDDYANKAFWQAEHFNAETNYLAYLQENADKLHELAMKAIHGYESNGNIYYLEAGGAMALPEFVTILNLNNPISPEESSQYNEANIFGGTFEEKYGI